MDAALLTKLEQEHGLQPGLLRAVMMQESGGVANAVSPRGAKGWFQFMPDTAKEYGVADPTDFTQAATGAAKYLGRLQRQFGSIEDTLRAYNWGQGNLRAYHSGKRKDMPQEAAEYPQKVLARLEQDGPPQLELDDPPDFDLPPDVEHPALKSGETPGPRDYQKELDNMPGTTLFPLAGSVVGGTMGAVAGAPTVVGSVPGAAIGGTLGAMLGHGLAIRTSDAPIEEKAKYLLKKFNIEATMNVLGTKGVQALTNVLAKTPAERLALEEWFRINGSKVAPVAEGVELSGRAGAVHRAAQRDMEKTIDEAIGVQLQRLNSGGTPTDMGMVFQSAYRDVLGRINKEHDTLFAPFRHGTPMGDALTAPTANLRTIAGQVLQGFKDTKTTNKAAAAGADVVAIVQDLAKGKAVPLATLVAQKRALGQTANWETVAGSVDNSIRKKLYDALDEAIEAKLGATHPALLTQWNSANATASRTLGIVNDTMIQRLASSEKMDPIKVTEFVAEKASPATMLAYKKALGEMVRRGSLTKEQNAYLIDHVRRNWIEQNMSTSKGAADVYEAIHGTGKNAEAVDAFNAVFNGSPLKATLEEAAKAAHAVRKYAERIPGQTGSAGEYVTGGTLGTAVGGPAGGTIATAAVYLTNVIPKALAKSALNNDKMLRNKARFVINWMNSASSNDLKSIAKGNLTVMPANVAKIYFELQGEVNE